MYHLALHEFNRSIRCNARSRSRQLILVSLDLVWWFTFLAAAVAFSLSSCALTVGEVHAYGPVWLVTHEDIRATISADHGCSPMSQDKIAYIDIISRDEMHVYHAFGISMYDDIRRVRGHWKCTGWVMIE